MATSTSTLKKWVKLTGFLLNIFGAIIISLFTYYFLPIVFHVSLGNFPIWAK